MPDLYYGYINEVFLLLIMLLWLVGCASDTAYLSMKVTIDRYTIVPEHPEEPAIPEAPEHPEAPVVPETIVPLFRPDYFLTAPALSAISRKNITA